MLSKIDVKCNLQKNNFHFSVEEMGNKEDPAEPKNRKSKTTKKEDNLFNFFGMIRSKPAFHFVRKGTTTNVILTNTHDVQPLALFLDYIIL
jgi:hypothetical protein